MKFFSCKNLTEKSVSPSIPWEFSKERPNEKICLDKEERQIFYRTKSTCWDFYSGVEGVNPNQRVSKDNPPKFIHAFVADYDLNIPTERVDEAVTSMSIKPAWIERSLGGNCRLVWLLPRPLAVETSDFAIWILQAARKFLSLDLLPGLDQGAFEDPTRLYCNGAEWRTTDKGLLNENKLQSFFVEAARKFKFKAPEGNVIPLEVVEKSIREQFPNFSWPSGFDLDSQGPSFWIPESASPLSAIVKPDGMLTFSAHATKPFYSWSDILGADFVKQVNEESITKATIDIFHDGHSYWRIIDGIYQSASDSAMKIYLQEGCGIPAKKVNSVLHHLHENCRITGAAPFVFRPPGLITYNHRKVLNTWKDTVMKPATGAVPENLWVLDFLRSFFDPPEQFDWFMAWAKYFYTSAVERMPRPGCNVFIMGPANRGKTFASRMIIGAIIGGFVDATEYIVRGDAFGSENFHVPLWCIDDSTPGNSAGAHDKFAAMLKKAAANQQHRYHCKFEVPCTIEWAGRVIITANVDFASSRILGSLDNTSADKTCVFRATGAQLSFPERYELQKMLATELPLFCRWLLDWEVPATVPRESRYGYAPYHESTILDQTHQTSKAAPLKEILIEELRAFFALQPEAVEWRGTLTQLCRLIQVNPANEFVFRSFKPEMINRYLEMIEREGIIKCKTEVGEAKQRIWVFPKF